MEGKNGWGGAGLKNGHGKKSPNPHACEEPKDQEGAGV